MGNKELFKKVLLDGVSEILKGNKKVLEHNIALISNLIDSMNKTELDNFINDLDTGKIVLPLIIPNGSKGIEYEGLKESAKKLNIPTHKKLIVIKNGKKIKYSIPRLILELPVKKLSQLLDKKRSIADDQNSVNHLTGQVTGASKSMSITAPELSLMGTNGQHDSIRELTKYRGGDASAKIVLEKMAELDMPIDQNILEQYSSGPEVNNTVKQLLLGMHIDASIGELKKK